MAWLEELLQTRWHDLKVHITTVSEQWAAVSVAGPKSRETLSKCVEDYNILSNENLPDGYEWGDKSGFSKPLPSRHISLGDISAAIGAPAHRWNGGGN